MGAGRVVVVLDDRPREPGVPLAGPEGVRFLRRAYKIANAREHGAAAILLAPSSDAEGLPGDAGNEDANPTRQEAGILALAAVVANTEASSRETPNPKRPISILWHTTEQKWSSCETKNRKNVIVTSC